jgi:uncharacterized protein YukE
MSADTAASTAGSAGVASGSANFTHTGSSGSGSGYSSRTLDELRLLAGSIDTGRIEAMQGSFSTVAGHLELVAASLARLRDELPNWWQGPSADATEQHFAQVIDRTRQAQDTAQGASTALRMCTQVVAAQQEAMKTVPEVEDPNTAAPSGPVPPGEPFSVRAAAMTAHQQAYAAARGQAERHVDGIAAQYVETTAQLQGLTGNYGENFQPVANTTSALGATAMSGHSSMSSSAKALPPKTAARQVAYGAYEQNSSQRTSPSEMSFPPQTQLASFHRNPSTSVASRAVTSSQRPVAERDTAGGASGVVPSIITGTTIAGAVGLLGAASRKPSQVGEALLQSAQRPLLRSGHEPLAHPLVEAHESVTRPVIGERREPYFNYDENGRPHFSSMTGTKPESAQPTNAGQEMYGPLATAGVRGPTSEREERGQRLHYLKESKSVWLPDASVAPHDGIMTPEWDEQ